MTGVARYSRAAIHGAGVVGYRLQASWPLLGFGQFWCTVVRPSVPGRAASVIVERSSPRCSELTTTATSAATNSAMCRNAVGNV